jgi:release factor glutamine methyltransferase
MTFTSAYTELSEKLAAIYDCREASIIARYLLEDLFQAKFWSETEMTKDQIVRLEDVTQRLLKHEPWQYIGGQADFYGLKFKVNPSVLIPRPETEELVFIALDFIKNNDVKSIMDIGTGSGIIPITIGIKSQQPLTLLAIDISVDALSVAHENAEMHDVFVEFAAFDFLDRSQWADLPKVDVIISNPPYIGKKEKSEMSSNVIDYEPHMALFVKDDVMEFYEAMGAFVSTYQNDGCFILTEINEKHGEKVKEVFEVFGLKHVTVIKDMQGKDRIVSACK